MARRVLFVGSKKIGLRCLRSMYSTAPDTVQGILTLDDTVDTRSVMNDFKTFGESHGIPVMVASTSRDSETYVGAFRPEMCIVVGWYWLISERTLKSVRHGWLGLHNSLLPRYRGGSPLVWAMMNGEREVGISLFTLTGGMDDGDIWGQRRVTVERSDYISDVLSKLEAQAESLFADDYLPILNGARTPVRQDPSQATYCAMRQPTDGVIDWTRPAGYVYDFIRSQSDPYPGAFTYSGADRIRIWRAETLPFEYHGVPGHVAEVSERGVTVICGDCRPILVTQVQGEKGDKTQARDLLRSVKLRLGR